MQFGVGRLADIHRLVGRNALARNFVALEFALGEDRQDVVEFLDLLDFDALEDAALGGELGLPAFDVGDVDRIRLGEGLQVRVELAAWKARRAVIKP